MIRSLLKAGVAFVALAPAFMPTSAQDLRTAPVATRPPPAPSPTPTARELDERIRQQAQAGTLGPEPQYFDAEGNRIIQEGPEWARRATRDQRERVETGMRESMTEVARRLGRDLPDLDHYAETRIDQFRQDAEVLTNTFDPARANSPGRQEMMNDPNYARNLSRSLVGSLRNLVDAEQEMGRAVRPLLDATPEALAGSLAELQQVMIENGASAAEIAELSEARRRLATQGATTVARNMNQHETDVRRAQTFINDNQARIEADVQRAVERVIAQYGPDPLRWPTGARNQINQALPPVPPPTYHNMAEQLGLGRRVDQLRRATSPITQITAPPPAARPSPPTEVAGPISRTLPDPPAPTRTTGTTGSTRGTIPSGDPGAGLRVPRSQGGTGPEIETGAETVTRTNTPSSQPGGSISAEQMTARIERARQAAMDRANPQQTQMPPDLQTRLPRDRAIGESTQGRTSDVSLTRNTVPVNGGGGRGNRSNGGSTDAANGRAPGGQPNGGTTPDGPGRDVIRGQGAMLPGAGRSVNLADILRSGGIDPNAGGRPVSPQQRSAIERLLNAIPYNADGSLDTSRMYSSVRNTLTRFTDALFGPNPDAPVPARGGAPAPQRREEVVDNTPPRPVPTAPDYPTVSAEERARIARDARERREAQAAQAAAASAAQRAQQEAAAREAAERRAMVERSRIADENYRLYQDAVRRNAQDARWREMVEARFAPNASIVDRNYPYADGDSIRVGRIEQIYGASNYRDGNVARSLSSAGSGPSSLGNSMSSAGNSLSSVGWSLSSAGTDWRDPALESLYDALGYFTYRGRSNPWQSGMDGDPARAAQLAYDAGDFQLRFDRDGREGRESGGYLAANLFTHDDPYLRLLTTNGFTGLDSLLAQPFNVILTWGAGAFDLDLHMTGPLGEGTTNRFHIYYANAGNLSAQPFAQLIRDCICASGSEVILTSALNRGGVYRISVFNFGNQSATSTNLANASNAVIQIVRGGTTQAVGNGTTIIGGRVILTTAVPNGQPGNTWVAAELDPRNGRITVPGGIRQSPGSEAVE